MSDSSMDSFLKSLGLDTSGFAPEQPSKVSSSPNPIESLPDVAKNVEDNPVYESLLRMTGEKLLAKNDSFKLSQVVNCIVMKGYYSTCMHSNALKSAFYRIKENPELRYSELDYSEQLAVAEALYTAILVSAFLGKEPILIPDPMTPGFDPFAYHYNKPG